MNRTVDNEAILEQLFDDCLEQGMTVEDAIVASYRLFLEQGLDW